MHEFSLAQSLIEKIEEIRLNHNAKKVYSVYLLIGKYSGIVIDSFEFAFDVLKKEHNSLSDAKLITKIIETIHDIPNFCHTKQDEEINVDSYSTDIILKTIEME